jgi:hypothetical protein
LLRISKFLKISTSSTYSARSSPSLHFDDMPVESLVLFKLCHLWLKINPKFTFKMVDRKQKKKIDSFEKLAFN